MKRHSPLTQLDPVLVSLLLGLTLTGVMVIHSAGGGAAYGGFAQRQVYWMAVAFSAFLVGFFAERRHLMRAAYLLYGAVLVFIAALAVTTKVTGGVHRWIQLGGMTFQPAELGKLTLILCLARYFSDLKAQPPYGLKQIALPIALVLGYALPVAMQPDLGTAALFMFIAVPIFLFAGIRRRTLVLLFGVAAASAPSLFFSLKPYQQERILNFMKPGRDPLGTGYHVVQSKIAIGSGGILGKGYMEGSQSQLHFIPEQHTDFIVSVLAEEFGFVGVLVLLGAILFLSIWALGYLEHARSRFAVLVVVGVVWGFALQAAINIAMTAGILPVVGIPLPLLSYGGSSLVVTWLGFGIIAGLKRRRP